MAFQFFFCIFFTFSVHKVPKKVPKNSFLTLKSTKNYTEYQKNQKVPKYPKIPELPKSTNITQKYPKIPKNDKKYQKSTEESPKSTKNSCFIYTENNKKRNWNTIPNRAPEWYTNFSKLEHHSI